MGSINPGTLSLSSSNKEKTMKKLIIVISILVMPLLILAGTSDFPRGLTVATEAEKATADVPPGAGDIYVPGTLEVDGAVRLDGTYTQTGEVDVDFDAHDEEFDITTSSGVVAGGGVLRVYNSDSDVTTQHYLLKLEYNDDGDADADFIICLDSASTNTKFLVAQDGDTTIAGTLAVTGAATLGVVNVTGATDISATLTLDGAMVYTPPTAIVVDTGTIITVTDRYVILNATGTSQVIKPFASTPMLSTSTHTNGTVVTFIGEEGSIVFDDNANQQLAGGSEFTLSIDDNITLYLRGDVWIEIGESDN